MTYEEESYVLDTLKELQDTIRSPTFNRLTKEVHENNVMLHQICDVINHWLRNVNQENESDFGRNVLANMLSNLFELRGLGRK